MTKHTQEQLQEMTNEQLDEIVALLQGWVRTEHYNGAWMDGDSLAYYLDDYHPSTNKEQMVDLMILCRLAVDCDEYDVTTTGGTYSVDFTEQNTPYAAVTIAAILYLQGSE